MISFWIFGTQDHGFHQWRFLNDLFISWTTRCPTNLYRSNLFPSTHAALKLKRNSTFSRNFSRKKSHITILLTESSEHTNNGNIANTSMTFGVLFHIWRPLKKNWLLVSWKEYATSTLYESRMKATAIKCGGSSAVASSSL